VETVTNNNNNNNKLPTTVVTHDDDDMSLQDWVDTSLKHNNNNNNNGHNHSPEGRRKKELKQCLQYLQYEDEIHEGASYRDISLGLRDLYQPFPGQDESVEGGYGTLLNLLAKHIGYDRIRFQSIVKTIQYNNHHTTTHNNNNNHNNNKNNNNNNPSNGGGVRIWLDNEEEECVEADYCVCTVPLGVLQQRRIRFEPNLPQLKWNAVDSIGMGTLNKVVLRFPHCFWGDELESLGVLHENGASHHKVFYDGTDETNNPILYCFLGGDASYRVDPPPPPVATTTNQKSNNNDNNKATNGGGDGMTDDAIVNEIMDTLRTVFGGGRGDDDEVVVPDPLDYKVTRWNTDPFAFGSYSYTKVGCTEEAYDELIRPVGNLLFAGEATSKTSHATVHGAWLSGEREAKRLQQQQQTKK